MKNLLSDTDTKTKQMIYDHLSTLSVQEKFTKMVNLIAFGRQLMIAGIKEQYPTANEGEIREQLAIRLLGKELALKVINCKSS